MLLALLLAGALTTGLVLWLNRRTRRFAAAPETQAPAAAAPSHPDKQRLDKLLTTRERYIAGVQLGGLFAGFALFYCFLAAMYNLMTPGFHQAPLLHVFGFALVCLGGWWFCRRCAQLLARMAPAVQWGATLEEAARIVDTEVVGDTEGRRASEMAEEYYQRHRESIDALEAAYMKDMVEKYRFRPEVARAFITYTVNRKPLSSVALWHKYGEAPEKYAEAAYNTFRGTARHSDPEVFTHDALTGAPLEAGSKPSALKWAIFGSASTVTREQKIIAAALYPQLILIVAFMFLPPYIPSDDWMTFGTPIALAAGCALALWMARMVQTGKVPLRKGLEKPGAIMVMFQCLLFAGMMWFAVVICLGEVLTIATGRIEGASIPVTRGESRVTTAKKPCVSAGKFTRICIRRETYDSLQPEDMLGIQGEMSWFGIVVRYTQ